MKEQQPKLKVAAIVPAYNVAKYIGRTIEKLKKCSLVDYIIVIDDHSTDETYEIASKADVIVIQHRKNEGVGGAIKTGFKKTLEMEADVAVIIAGDGQMPISELPKFLQKCQQGYGLVIGNRFAENDPRKFGMPTIRYYGAKILSVMTYISTGHRIPDCHNGYSALTRDALQKINIDTLFARWGVHNDIISRCAVAGVPITTVPQVPKFLDENGQRIQSNVWVLNIVLPNLYVYGKLLLRSFLNRVGIKKH